MNGRYFSQSSWPSFIYQGNSYDLSHLDEYQFQITDSAKVDRKITVTFSDHCFTRSPEPGDDPALLYAGSSRNPGYFCVDRYLHSLQIRAHIAQAVSRKVWQLDHQGYACVPTVDHQGRRVLYGIVFALDRVTGLPVDLHMRVRSAHLRDQNEIITFGTVDFSHLVRLRVEGKEPKRIYDKKRKKPRPV